MTSALAKLAAFAVSLISFALLYKQFNIEGWETSAFLGGAVLFFVITAIIGGVFKLEIIPSLLLGSIVTAFIMGFVAPMFSIIMMFVFFVLLMIALAWAEGG